MLQSEAFLATCVKKAFFFLPCSESAQSMQEALCPLLPARQPSPGLLLSEWRHLPVFCRIFWIVVMVRKRNRIK